jgi:Hint module
MTVSLKVYDNDVCIGSFGVTPGACTVVQGKNIIAECLAAPPTRAPTTAVPTTAVPTRTPTAAPTTAVPTTAVPTTAVPTRTPTAAPTTAAPTGIPTTAAPTTATPSAPTSVPSKFPSVIPTIRSASAEPSAATSNSAKEEANCFAGDEQVELKSGDKIAISAVKVGYRVLSASPTGHLSYADVIAVLHSKNEIEASFVIISTPLNDLKLTPDHFLMAGVCGSQMILSKASDVSVGSFVMTVTGSAEVTATSVVRGKGVYVVNGIVASPFALNHYAANSFYNVFRGLYKIAPAVMKSSFMANLYMKIRSYFPVECIIG